ATGRALLPSRRAHVKARRGPRHAGGEGPHPPYAWRRIDRALLRTSAFPSVHLSAAIMPQLGVPGNRGAGEPLRPRRPKRGRTGRRRTLSFGPSFRRTLVDDPHPDGVRIRATRNVLPGRNVSIYVDVESGK